jgi:Collagen triple helix repeat (20 copies)
MSNLFLCGCFSKTSAPHFQLSKGFTMNHSIIISALIAALSLTACDQKPTVVNVPAGPPGPAGAKGAPGVEGVQGSQGETGAQGNTGNKGETGKTGDSTTVIVTPPAEPAN